MTRVLWAVVIGILALAPAGAEEWPGFRGPNGQGVSAETSVPTRWSPTENIAWRTEIPGKGWSSPIVTGERVFVTTATDGGKSFRLLCLDRKSGKVLWDNEVLRQELSQVNGRNSHATATPVTDGERVYVLAYDGSVAAVGMDGRKVWEYREVKFYSQHGLGVSPILYKDLVIVTYDGSNRPPEYAIGWQKPWDKALILALDKRTGAVRWRGSRGMSRIAHVTPTIRRDPGGDQLISAAGEVVQGHDLATGERLWSAAYPGEGVVPSVVLGDGVVFTSSGFGATAVCATRPGSRQNPEGQSLWKRTKNAPTMSSFLYRKPHLFVVHEKGMAQCLDAATGEALWETPLRGSFCASPVYAAGNLYFLSDSGECVVVEAKGEFREVARNPLNERCQASPAISGGRIFIRTEKALYCIGQ